MLLTSYEPVKPVQFPIYTLVKLGAVAKSIFVTLGALISVNSESSLQFSTEIEQLAFPIRPEKGEVDSFVVYPEPDVKVLEKLRENKTRTELWDDLPTELEYGQIEKRI